MTDIILIAIAALLITAGILWRRRLGRVSTYNITYSDDTGDDTQAKVEAADAKRLKRTGIITIAIITAGGWLLITRAINLIFGAADADAEHFSIWPERVDLFGFSVSVTIIYSWIIMAALIIAAVIIRVVVFKHPDTTPSGVQNAVETVVEIVGDYTNAQAHGTGEMLCSYILTVGAFLISCAFLELFRLRPPTSDITVTFSLALLTFVLINIYGFKRKGVIGRFKSLASPTPLVFPFRIISEIAVPVSLACRLFGNILGGMIVVDLLYNALGNNAVGIPGVLGIYFNAFHPLIQTFIFITLTLTFINEAIE